MSTFEELKSKYIITGTLILESALGIGSGGITDPIGTDAAIMRGGDGRPIIPGSSLKGIIRTHVERVLRTLDQQNYTIENSVSPLFACDPLDQSDKRVGCLSQEQASQYEDDIDGLLKKLCTACLLFGSHAISSRIFFSDSYISPDQEIITEIRDGVGIDRDTGTAKPGVKFDYEVLSKGHEFTFQLEAENLQKWEFGLLCMALRELHTQNIHLGGRTTKGLGRLSFKPQSLQIVHITSDNFLEFLADTISSSPLDFNSHINEFISQLQH